MAEDTFMSEMHLRQREFMYSVCGPFNKKARIQKFRATGDSRYIYRIEVDKDCSQHNMTYEDFKGLPRIKASDIYLIRYSKLLVIQSMADMNVDYY